MTTKEKRPFTKYVVIDKTQVVNHDYSGYMITDEPVSAGRRAAVRYSRAAGGFALFCVLLFAAAAAVSAQDRFPRPEFQNGYEIPPDDLGSARAAFYYYMDVAALFAALCAAAYLVHKRRSRRGLALLALFSIAYFGFYKKGCVCSLGSIQNVTAGIFGDYVIPASVFLIFALPLAFALFFGRVYCSAVCPMGALQDFAALRARRVPARVSAALKIVPHVYLGAAVLFAATGAGFPICKLDPFVGIFRLSAPPGGLILGAAFLLLGVFVARPYCRYLCPYGLILGWMSSISKYRVKVCPDKCVNCRLCENACPVDAIRRPAAEPVSEQRARALRRLKIYCALVPLWIAALSAAGWLSADLVSPLHPQVRLLRAVEREESGASITKSLESEALRVDAGVAAELRKRADAARTRFRLGMLLLGAYLGIVVSAYLIRQSIYSKRGAYEADPASCVSCGRCYRYCPKQKICAAEES